MSGFEVAGVALGVFTVLISGLNNVVDGIETAKRWKRYRSKLKDYADILESASVFFLDTLDELLGDIVISEEEVAALLHHPEGILWKRKEYEERLRKRLDRSHMSYLKAVSKLAGALQSMCERLGVDKAGTVQWDDYTILEREMKRMKLTFSKSIYKDLLNDIHQANQNLREFMHQNLALEPVKQKRPSRRPLADLRLVRANAASLYQVLMAGETWKCTCNMHHLASLRLEARLEIIETEVDPAQKHSSRHGFRILLSVAKEATNTATAMRLQGIEIIPSIEIQNSDMAATSRRDAHRTRSVGVVRFAPEAQIDPGLRVPEGNSSTETTRVQMTAIESFCSALDSTDLEQSPREIGVLIDKTREYVRHKIYRADIFPSLQTSPKSLENLLSSHKQPGDEGLSRKNRLHIAVILASSVLQLDGTTWLKSGWSSNDILFHSKDGPLSNASPYLSWQKCSITEGSCSLDSFHVGNYMIRSDILLALGLTLVELCFGRTLAGLYRSDDWEDTEKATRLKTAIRLHKRVYDEMGIAYGDVVRRCLFQSFDVRELSLDIEEVQQMVFDTVVTPLAEDLKNFNGELRIR
ncbi:MAG: hypothetical protein Q9222_001936 [Ikaeria aurantiellina]